MREIPKLRKAKFSKGYARLIGAGLDTLEETYNLELDETVLKGLDDAKEEARANGDGTPVTVQVGREEFQIAGHGGKFGVAYVMGNESFLVRIRPGKQWPVSLRYTSGGLWGEGYAELKARALNFLTAMTPGQRYNGLRGEIEERIKRADFAFDFHSPAFSSEILRRGGTFYNDIVAHSSVKRNLTGAGSVETITIGSKQRLELQVYDKGKEITEHSGKTWMFDLWEQHGWERPEDGKAKDVWRLECRFGKEFLRSRKIIDTYEFLGAQQQLITEAIYERRLTRPSNDKNRARWPLHPLWYIAGEENGGVTMPPIGKRITMRREALSAMLLKQATGVLRARAVLDHGDFKERHVDKISKTVDARLGTSCRDREAVERARERYKHVDDMK